jgi:hypothetical protein
LFLASGRRRRRCGLISTPKPQTATSGKPKEKRAARPSQPSGYEWRKNGAGSDLRKVVWVEDATSGKQRKRPYLGRLSKSAFAEMKRQHLLSGYKDVIARDTYAS